MAENLICLSKVREDRNNLCCKRADTELISFVALVQQINRKEEIYLANSQRLQKLTSLLVGDQTYQYFKLVCWGKYADLTPERVSVGDILYFHNFCVKSYRGNLEAHHTGESDIKLLFRDNRFHQTVPFLRLNDLNKILQWVTLENRLVGFDQIKLNSVPFRRIGECREHMIVSLVGKLTKQIMKNSKPAVDEDGSNKILYQIVLLESPNVFMYLNLWNQFAKPSFWSSLKFNSIVYEIKNLVIAYNSSLNSLVANSISSTTICELNTADSRSAQVLQDFGDSISSCLKNFDELTQTELNGIARIDGVKVSSIEFQRHINLDMINGDFRPLVQSFCISCECSIIDNKCPSGCSHFSKSYRYFPFHMTLTDRNHDSLDVIVLNNAAEKLFCNVSARDLIAPVEFDMQYIDPHFIVSELISSLINDKSQEFTGIIFCSRLEDNNSALNGSSLNLSSHVYNLESLDLCL